MYYLLFISLSYHIVLLPPLPPFQLWCSLAAVAVLAATTSAQSPAQHIMGRYSIIAIIISMLYMVGGEFETVYEVGIYGTRPRNSEDKTVMPGEEYYKYQQLGLDEQQDHTTASPSVKKKYQARVKNKGGGDEVGSCYQCSTLSDTAQRDPGNYCYNISRYKEMKEKHKDEVGWEPPGVEGSLVSRCKDTHRYCQVRRVDYKVDNMTTYAQWSLERACVKECEPFCVSMGGRTKVTYCTSCCRWDGKSKDPITGRWVAGPRDDNCNVGNAGEHTWAERQSVNMIATGLMILYFTF